MELSDKCVKELQAAVDDEVKRRTVKMKQRVDSMDKERKRAEEKARAVVAELTKCQGAQKAAQSRGADLEVRLREAQAAEKALRTALAEKAEASA